MVSSMADANFATDCPDASIVAPFPSLTTSPISPTSSLPAPASAPSPPQPPPRKCDCVPPTGPEAETTGYQPGNACTRTGVWMTLNACGHTVRQFCLERSIERAPLIGLNHRQSWLAPCSCMTSWQMFCAGSHPPPPPPPPSPSLAAAVPKRGGGGGGGGARAKKPTKKQLLQLTRKQMPPAPPGEASLHPDREPEDGAPAGGPVGRRRRRKVPQPLKNAEGSAKKRPAAKKATRGRRAVR